MARRRRRGRFRRQSPDMGWWTSQEEMSFTHTTGEALDFATVFEFNDIDADDALITQDKSDWFIKRVILDLYPVVGRPSAPTSGPARIYECALGTMDLAKAANLVSSPQEVLSADFYEQWRRLFKTYTRPVYSTWEPTLDGSILQVDTTPTNNEINVADSPWGAASIHDDFSVSNAGLVHDTAMFVVVSTTDTAPSTRFEWAAGDTFSASAYIRVLLQKRRT